MFFLLSIGVTFKLYTTVQVWFDTNNQYKLGHHLSRDYLAWQLGTLTSGSCRLLLLCFFQEYGAPISSQGLREVRILIALALRPLEGDYVNRDFWGAGTSL